MGQRRGSPGVTGIFSLKLPFLTVGAMEKLGLTLPSPNKVQLLGNQTPAEVTCLAWCHVSALLGTGRSGFPCLIHRKQEAESRWKVSSLSWESSGRWQSRWALDHGVLVKSRGSCWAGDLCFLTTVFLTQIPHDTDLKSLSFHLAWPGTSVSEKELSVNGLPGVCQKPPATNTGQRASAQGSHRTSAGTLMPQPDPPGEPWA